MGPFDEDKIFIMEKGRKLNMNQEITNLVSLPESLLLGLIENSKQEEWKEEYPIRAKYENYIKFLNNHLKTLE